jgi:hypothetical protein
MAAAVLGVSMQQPWSIDTAKDSGDDLDSPQLVAAKQAVARKVPSRVLLLKRNADYDTLIGICSRKLSQSPGNSRALLIRASAFLKKGEQSWQPSLDCVFMSFVLC